MIKRIKFSNFYSFKNEQTIDFTAQKKNTYDYYTSKSGEQITKVAGFIGANASGKTNVMKLLSFLGHFICKSTSSENNSKSRIAFNTHFYNSRPSKFEIEFENENIIFYYKVIVKLNEITEEKLSLKIIEKDKPTRKIIVFSRNSGQIEKLNKNYFSNLKPDALKNVRQDISLIGFIHSIYKIDIINKVFNYFSNLKTNINEIGEITNEKYQIRTLQLYLSDSSIREEMNNIVNNFDLGLKKIDIKKEKQISNKHISGINDDRSKEEEFIFVSGVHSTNEKSKRIGFDYESRGTKSLFFTIANILYAIKHQSVVIIDEIEMGLHPEALNKILHYFIDQSADKTSQLIFSSQSLNFMNQFDMHQLFLVQKDNECQSSIYRLNEVEKIRSDENFFSKYMSGAYGAFPMIKI